MAAEFGLYMVPPIIAGMVSLGLGTFVLYKHPKDISSNVFFILMMSLSIWMFGEFAMQISSNVNQALVFGKISNMGFIIMPVALLHFTLVYPTLTIPPDKKMLYQIFLYIPVTIMIVLLLATNSFFTVDTGKTAYGPDTFIDGDGDLTAGRGTADGPNGTFRVLAESDSDAWFYFDINDNNWFDFDENETETLVFQSGINDIIIVGAPGADPVYRKPLITAQNQKYIYWLDNGNVSNGFNEGIYDTGEDIYIDDNGYDGIQIENETVVKVAEENYRYVPTILYFGLIIFFFIFVIITKRKSS